MNNRLVVKEPPERHRVFVDAKLIRALRRKSVKGKKATIESLVETALEDYLGKRT